GRMVGTKPAPDAQLRDRQARQGARQFERAARQIHDGALQLGTWAMFDEDIQSYMGTTGAQFMSYDRYGKTSQKGAFGSSFIVAGPALKRGALGGFATARLDLFGPDLAAFMKRAARGLTRIGAFGEELPNIENRIELASDKDEFGMPLAKIIHSYDPDAV